MENISVFAAIRSNRMVGGKVPVIIRIIIGRSVAKNLATGIKVAPAAWDPVTRSVFKTEPNANVYNMKLKKEISALDGKFAALSVMGIPITNARAKQIAEGKDPSRNFYQFCREWLPQKYSNKETLRTYRSELTKMERFRTDVSFGDIDHKYLTQYQRYMKRELHNAKNTVWKTLKFLNTMFEDAIKMKGLVDHNPVSDFDRGRYENPEKLGLELLHCDLIEPLCTREDLPVIVRRVATRFLLMCYCGLRFNDAIIFDPDLHIINGERIFLKTQKAGVVINIKLYDRLSKIVDLIRINPLPLMSNQKFNEWLKIVAGLAGIAHIKLTCHVGRHTFGGILAELEIPQEQAQIIMGHKDIRSTQVYYHVKGKNIDNAMDKLNKM